MSQRRGRVWSRWGLWLPTVPVLVMGLLATVRPVAAEEVPGIPGDDTLPFTGLVDIPAPPLLLDENCTVSILNRTARVRPNGTWVLPNVPATVGQIRARATCVEDGITRAGQSDFFVIPANGSVDVPRIVLGEVEPIPESLSIAAPSAVIASVGGTLPLAVTATFPDGSTEDFSRAASGTDYTTSNAGVVTVSGNGLVTAVTSGVALVSALNEGALGIFRVSVVLSGDSDGDGIPDDVEIANGLDPNDPVDGIEDRDGDGLTNKQELVDLGTLFDVADSDGDGIGDGEEVVAGEDGFVTDPLLADTDGDGVRDALEIASGSDPADSESLDLAAIVERLEVEPSSFTITVNTLVGEAFRDLRVAGRLIDGTTLDLTSTQRGTDYASSDLSVCNFGAEDGRVFGGQDGNCTITVGNSGFEAIVGGAVRTFAPEPRGFVAVPGFANAVDVLDGVAYVASGGEGIQVVDARDPDTPAVVLGIDTSGNANDVRVSGGLLYLADGPDGLEIFDLADPLAPVLLGSVDTPGIAQDVAVRGNLVAVADGASGVQIVDASDPAAPVLLGSIETSDPAKGVAFTEDGRFLAVAVGAQGLELVDLADPTAPAVVATQEIGGDARDVVVKGGFALVADFSKSLTVIEIADPRSPIFRQSTPRNTGGLLNDLTVRGDFVFGADVLFVNEVPIVDLRVPGTPLGKGTVDFSAIRDDNGHGIAVDENFVYLTANRDPFGENGTSSDSRLYIGQYLAVEDADRDGFRDDEEVAAGSDPLDPISVPPGDADGDGIPNAEEVIPGADGFLTDPRNPDSDGDGVDDGVEVATPGLDPVDPDVDRDGFLDGDEIAAGRDPLDPLSVPPGDADDDGIPNAEEVIPGADGFVSDPLDPDSDGDGLTDGEEVIGGADGLVTDPLNPDSDGDGVPDSLDVGMATITSPTAEDRLVEGSTATVTVDVVGAVDFSAIEVDFLLDGNVVFRDATAPYAADVVVSVGATSATFGAVARNGLGNEGSALPVAVPVVAAQATTVAGQIVDRDGEPLEGILVRVRGVSTVTDAAGDFSMGAVSSALGAIRAAAEQTFDGILTIRGSDLAQPVPGGVTDVGPIVWEPRLVAPVFAGQTFPTPGSGSGRLAVGDVNGDSFPDVVRQSSVLLGYGDGDFQDAIESPLLGSFPTLADMDGDANLDVVSAFEDDLAIWLGNGDGTFRDPRRVPAGDSDALGRLVATADLDGDGRLDVVVANEEARQLWVFLGNGDGSVQPGVFTEVNGMIPALAIADLDWDGTLDLAIAQNGAVAILPGTGTGGFGTPEVISLGDHLNRPVSIAAGDVNGDGRIDLVTANSPDSPTQVAEHAVSVLLGAEAIGGAGLAPGDDIFSAPVGLLPDERRAWVELEDIDFDGALDIVTVNAQLRAVVQSLVDVRDGGVQILFGEGDGSFPTEARFETSIPAREVRLADFDRDGALDYLLPHGDGTGNHYVSLYRGDPGGDFDRLGQQILLFGDSPQVLGLVFGPSDVAAADMNGDGLLDVVAIDIVATGAPSGRTSPTLSIALGNGDGTFQPDQSFALGPEAGILPGRLAVGDLNGDANLDVAITIPEADEVAVLLGNGNGTLQPALRFATSESPIGVALGDLDLDGDLEIVTAGSAEMAFDSVGQVAILEGRGDGTFLPPLTRSTGGTRANTPRIADLDEDGFPDIVVGDVNIVEPGVKVFFGTGRIQPAAVTTIHDETRAFNDVADVALVDLDGDGLLDVVSASEHDDLRVQRNLGGRSFAPVQLLAEDSGRRIAVGDLDLDGHPDLMAASGGKLAVLFGRGDGTFHPEHRFAVLGPQIALGDMNADNAPDLLVAAGVGVLSLHPNLFSDVDGDALADDREAELGTDPANPDTDGDGLLDGFERTHGFDPLTGGDGGLDADADGLTNLEEQAAGTAPNVPDTDADGLLDGFEATHGFNPRRAGDQLQDSDADGLDNLAEQSQSTDPRNPDSDGDGLLDGFELNHGFDPLVPGDETLDPDEDGLPNGAEQLAGTDPRLSDTDQDGLSDGDEVNAHATDPLAPDSDGDELLDGEEVFLYGTDPLMADTDGGGRSDGEEVLVGGTNPLDGSDDVSLLPITLIDGLGFEWEIGAGGVVGPGPGGAFDAGFELVIDGSMPFAATAAELASGDREVAIGPESIAGLEVVRKVFVHGFFEGFIRYLEIFDNPGSDTITVNVEVVSDLRADAAARTASTSSGDAVLDAFDGWVVTDGGELGPSPAVGHVFSGEFAQIQPVEAAVTGDEVRFVYTLTLAPGERAALLHFGVQRERAADAQQISNGLREHPSDGLDGVDPEDIEAILNFSIFLGGPPS